MKQALVPDSSALVVVLEDRWVQDVERDLQRAQARQVITSPDRRQIGSKEMAAPGRCRPGAASENGRYV